MNNLEEQFKDKDSEELNIDFIAACVDGDLEVIQYLLTSEKINQLTNNTGLLRKSHGLDKAVVHGRLDIVDLLLTKTELKNDPDLSESLNSALQYACMYGHLNIVKYLLTSPNLKLKPNIHANCDDALFHACSSGYLDIVEYLLDSPELTEHSSILPRFLPITAKHGNLDIVKYLFNHSNGSIKEQLYSNINVAFVDACESGQLDIVKFLLNSNELSKNADLHYNKDSAFESAFYYHQTNVLEYLILDLYIEKNDNINTFLNSASNHQLVSIVNKLFNLRELNKELNEDLIKNDINDVKRIKI